MQTLRDLKIAYIKKLMDAPKCGDIYSDTFVTAYEYLKREKFELAKDITERIRDDVEEGFIDAWRNKVYDYLISKIDWDSLLQCKTCYKFFDAFQDLNEDSPAKFCSEDCLEAAYEEVPDRGERRDDYVKWIIACIFAVLCVIAGILAVK